MNVMISVYLWDVCGCVCFTWSSSNEWSWSSMEFWCIGGWCECWGVCRCRWGSVKWSWCWCSNHSWGWLSVRVAGFIVGMVFLWQQDFLSQWGGWQMVWQQTGWGTSQNWQNNDESLESEWTKYFNQLSNHNCFGLSRNGFFGWDESSMVSINSMDTDSNEDDDIRIERPNRWIQALNLPSCLDAVRLINHKKLIPFRKMCALYIVI